ncbi:MAG: alpha/beta hydrolase [Proteobacteria bacterium]|nr:alpha/beta hydrolase [Pseudomonadota bacterium]
MKDVMLNGAGGRIEGKLHMSSDPSAPAALILHPHPLHGGTMNNKVVYRLFHCFVKNDCTVLRYNSRGVGKSQGKYDSGVGERVDASLLLDDLVALAPEAQNYWICGFSFGAWIAMEIVMRRPEIGNFIAIAPPAHNHDFSFFSCHAEGLIIQGTEDQIVPEEKVYDLYEKISKQHDSHIEYVPMKADHFFLDQIDQLGEVVDSYIATQVSHGAVQPIARNRRDRKRRVKEIIE